jgi:hypothetical protein
VLTTEDYFRDRARKAGAAGVGAGGGDGSDEDEDDDRLDPARAGYAASAVPAAHHQQQQQCYAYHQNALVPGQAYGCMEVPTSIPPGAHAAVHHTQGYAMPQGYAQFPPPTLHPTVSGGYAVQQHPPTMQTVVHAPPPQYAVQPVVSPVYPGASNRPVHGPPAAQPPHCYAPPGAPAQMPPHQVMQLQPVPTACSQVAAAAAPAAEEGAAAPGAQPRPAFRGRRNLSIQAPERAPVVQHGQQDVNGQHPTMVMHGPPPDASPVAIGHMSAPPPGHQVVGPGAYLVMEHSPLVSPLGWSGHPPGSVVTRHPNGVIS